MCVFHSHPNRYFGNSTKIKIGNFLLTLPIFAFSRFTPTGLPVTTFDVELRGRHSHHFLHWLLILVMAAAKQQAHLAVSGIKQCIMEVLSDFLRQCVHRLRQSVESTCGSRHCILKEISAVPTVHVTQYLIFVNSNFYFSNVRHIHSESASLRNDIRLTLLTRK